MIGVGIIGCGKIAQIRHIPEYLENGRVKLTAFYDLNYERAKALAEVYGGTACKSYEELLNRSDVDAVSVCTATSDHGKITVDALNAGKHVLCEKPMAASLEEAEAMVEAANKNGRYLMIDQNQRLTKGHQYAKRLIERGEIGKIITFQTSFGHGGPEKWSIDSGKSTWFFDKKRAFMGAMADLGIHKIDLVQYLLGEVVAEIFSAMDTLDKKDADGKAISVEDNAFCVLRMESGIMGTMTASWTHYGAEDNSTVFYGSDGIMRIYDSPEYTIKVIPKSGGGVLYKLDQIQTNDHQTSTGIIDAFVSSILEEKEPEISGQSVLEAMRAVWAAAESAKCGKMIAVERKKQN